MFFLVAGDGGDRKPQARDSPLSLEKNTTINYSRDNIDRPHRPTENSELGVPPPTTLGTISSDQHRPTENSELGVPPSTTLGTISTDRIDRRDFGVPPSTTLGTILTDRIDRVKPLEYIPCCCVAPPCSLGMLNTHPLVTLARPSHPCCFWLLAAYPFRD
jgi:hypothetical protein